MDEWMDKRADNHMNVWTNAQTARWKLLHNRLGPVPREWMIQTPAGTLRAVEISEGIRTEKTNLTVQLSNSVLQRRPRQCPPIFAS